LGVVETRGMSALVSAVDAMLKAAGVRLVGRHGIGSGWVTAVVEGDVDAIGTAIRAGTEAVGSHGELIRTETIAGPDRTASDAMPHLAANVEPSDDGRALGLLETQGVAPLIVGADAVAKSADVELTGWAFIGGALCHLAVRGDVSAVRTAIDAGRRAVEPVGTVYASAVLPRPHAGVDGMLPGRLAGEPERVGALGVLETTGYAACVAGTDAMVKVADIGLRRFSIGSGGRIVALATGSVDDVRESVEAGRAISEDVGGSVAAHVVSSADEQVLACFGGTFSAKAEASGEAMGLLETRTTVGLVKAMDRMLKTASVTFEGNYKVGYFLTASVIRGDVSSVREALDVGAQEAARYGDVAGVHMIPHPYGALEERLPHR